MRGTQTWIGQIVNEKGSSIEELHLNMEAASREWRPEGAPTND